MKTGECPNCDHLVEVGDSPIVGNYVRCKDCGVELIIVWLNPLELDFTYYSEVGIIGLLLSYAIFFLIAFPIRGESIRVRWVGALMFIMVLLLSFTTEILPNISIVLIYSIIAMTYLIPEQDSLSISVKQS